MLKSLKAFSSQMNKVILKISSVKELTLLALLVFIACNLTSCNVGLKSVLFMTRTQLAIDADTEPANMDIGFDRAEFIVAPVFEKGQVLPVLSTIGAKAEFLNFASNTSFATGNAAIIIADAVADPDNYWENEANNNSDVPEPKNETDDKQASGVIRIPAEDSPKGAWQNFKFALFGSDKRKRYYFGTDTSFGLSVKWTGGNIPKSVNLGWKRKEVAFVPIIEKAVEPKEGETETTANSKVDLQLASLIATSGIRSKVKGQNESGANISQTFATGDAATLLAADGGVRDVVGPAIMANYDQVKEQVKQAKKEQDLAKRRGELITSIDTTFVAFDGDSQVSDQDEKEKKSIAEASKLELIKLPQEGIKEEKDFKKFLHRGTASKLNDETIDKLEKLEKFVQGLNA